MADNQENFYRRGREGRRGRADSGFSFDFAILATFAVKAFWLTIRKTFTAEDAKNAEEEEILNFLFAFATLATFAVKALLLNWNYFRVANSRRFGFGQLPFANC
ncbi:MAG TPA: hypothetical protein VFQ41_24340 [Candidatus Angelobacter sp.]|nr:hypothetical protein [Candidatus Angelobacter sp.]